MFCRHIKTDPEYDSAGDTIIEIGGTAERKEVILFDSQGDSITNSDYEDFLQININEEEASYKQLYIIIVIQTVFIQCNILICTHFFYRWLN